MRVVCPQCQARYNVDDRKIPATGAKVKCPKCTQKFGENPMYALKQEASQTSMGASEDVAEPAAT